MASDQHKCFEAAAAMLGKRNTKLVFAMQIPSGVEMLVVATEKVNSKERGTPLRMMATFCPFCGRYLS